MKDKLVKTGHRKLYYRIQTALVGLALAIVVTLFAAIPIAITYRLSLAEATADPSVSSSEKISSSVGEEGSSSSVEPLDSGL
ncbi:MAG: hypothetical protein LKG11_06555 [Bacilli bacterium]|jgi:hypothetical protein|nr:hypothetical protein [Bacilli bacterium]